MLAKSCIPQTTSLWRARTRPMQGPRPPASSRRLCRVWQHLSRICTRKQRLLWKKMHTWPRGLVQPFDQKITTCHKCLAMVHRILARLVEYDSRVCQPEAVAEFWQCATFSSACHHEMDTQYPPGRELCQWVQSHWASTIVSFWAWGLRRRSWSSSWRSVHIWISSTPTCEKIGVSSFHRNPHRQWERLENVLQRCSGILPWTWTDAMGSGASERRRILCHHEADRSKDQRPRSVLCFYQNTSCLRYMFPL